MSDPVNRLNVRRFADGSMAIICNTQAMHLNPTQAACLTGLLSSSLCDDMRNETPASPANARQVGGDHYRSQGIQVWDAVVAWGLGFLDGNVVKYVARYRRKGGMEDLQKARHYLDKLIETSATGGDRDATSH